MSRWRDTSTIPEDEGTFSESVAYYEKPVNTFDLELDESPVFKSWKMKLGKRHRT